MTGFFNLLIAGGQNTNPPATGIQFLSDDSNDTLASGLSPQLVFTTTAAAGNNRVIVGHVLLGNWSSGNLSQLAFDISLDGSPIATGGMFNVGGQNNRYQVTELRAGAGAFSAALGSSEVDQDCEITISTTFSTSQFRYIGAQVFLFSNAQQPDARDFPFRQTLVNVDNPPTDGVTMSCDVGDLLFTSGAVCSVGGGTPNPMEPQAGSYQVGTRLVSGVARTANGAWDLASTGGDPDWTLGDDGGYLTIQRIRPIDAPGGGGFPVVIQAQDFGGGDVGYRFDSFGQSGVLISGGWTEEDNALIIATLPGAFPAPRFTIQLQTGSPSLNSYVPFTSLFIPELGETYEFADATITSTLWDWPMQSEFTPGVIYTIQLIP